MCGDGEAILEAEFIGTHVGEFEGVPATLRPVRVPYSVAYGGLAAVIGLIIWMQLSAVIVFLGAAWNAELAESRKEAQVHA